MSRPFRGKALFLTEQQYDFVTRIMEGLYTTIAPMVDENGDVNEEDLFDYDIAHADAGIDLVNIFKDVFQPAGVDESFES